MKVIKEDLPKREVLLTIKLDDEDIEPHVQKAYERIIKRTNIPGFRKGKAPRAILERYLGKDALKEEALESLLPEALRDAINKEELDSAGMPRVDQVDGDPPVVKATVPLQPLVEFSDYLAIRVDEDSTEVTDEQVQELIQYLRKEQAPWEPANRFVSFGDQVTIDVRGSVDERVILDEKGIVYIATEENSSPIPGFVDQLIGMKTGDQKEFHITIPDGYGSDELIGNECVFHVTLYENKEKRLAELNDEFAKGVGDGYDSLASLEDKVRSDLQAEEERVARRKYEEKVVPLLVECAKIELSPLLVDHEVTHMLADERESKKSNKLMWANIFKMLARAQMNMKKIYVPWHWTDLLGAT